MDRIQFSALLVILLFICVNRSFAQSADGGTWSVQKFQAKSIQGNNGGEDAIRRVSVYLPPGYSKSQARYPVIYFLHGFGVNDSLMIEWLGLNSILDKAIVSGKIPPVIFVLPDSHTRYLGSFYTDSPLTGKWSTYIAKDVVDFVDQNFRTVKDRSARGLCGHSMGGNGAIKIAMNFPEVFAAVYALSPGALHWSHEFNLDNRSFKILSVTKDEKEILKPVDEPSSADDPAFWTPLLASLGRTFSPEESVVPHQAKFPVSYNGQNRTIDLETLKVWEANFPINMIEDHIDEMKSLKGIRIDWGRNDEFPHIPATCRQLSDRMEALGIPHQAEEYIGKHVDKIGGSDGRVANEVLPFFAALLTFPGRTSH